MELGCSIDREVISRLGTAKKLRVEISKEGRYHCW